MKSTVFALLMLSSFITVYAEEPKVETTSFRYVGRYTSAAELCGKVTGVEGATTVFITSDPKSKTPAPYQVMTKKDGTFCTLVATFTGKADVSLTETSAGETIVSITNR